MSDYDEYFDTIDDGVLAQVDALEAIGELGRSPNKPPAASTKKSSKSASISTPGDSDSALFDLTLDVNEMEKLEEAAARRLNAQPGPSRQGASRQIDLHGRPLPPQSPEKQVQHRPVFGQKMRKTKVWDQTAFAKTGWRSTKPVKSKKGKGKAVADDEGDDDEECVDLHDVPAPFMPRG
jgi:ATP-dependent DNA helicase MPH1